jgi:hypothetical protein
MTPHVAPWAFPPRIGFLDESWPQMTCSRADKVVDGALVHEMIPTVVSGSISTPILTHLMPSSGWAVTKHFLPGSTSAQPPLTQHRRSSVLMSSAHPRAQTPFKCCSGCSPSPHPCSVPVLGPYYDWIPTPC